MKFLDKILHKMNLSSNRRKVVKNVFWAVLGKVVNIVCGLLVGVMVARNLGPEKYGLMNYVISYVTIFSIFASFGLNAIEIRELSKKDAKKELILGTAFTLRVLFALATIVLILITLVLFESDAFTFSMVMIYSLVLVLSALTVIRNYFTSIILNEYVVKTEITRTLIGSGIKVILLLNHCSLLWFIVASTFDFFLIGGGYLYSYRLNGGVIREWKFDYSVARMLLIEAFPLLLSGTAVIIYQRIDQIMIRNMVGTDSLGLFSVALKIMELGIFVPVVICQTVAPLLVKAHQQHPEYYRNEKRPQFMALMVWSGIAISFVISVLAAPAIRVLYGEEYWDAIPVLQIMAWKTAFVALFTASGQIIIVENLQRYAVVRNLLGCAVNVLLNILLIPMYGIKGSAVAAVITMAFSGYFAHFVISPYRFLVPIQTHALFFGWKRVLNMLHFRGK